MSHSTDSANCCNDARSKHRQGPWLLHRKAVRPSHGRKGQSVVLSCSQGRTDSEAENISFRLHTTNRNDNPRTNQPAPQAVRRVLVVKQFAALHEATRLSSTIERCMNLDNLKNISDDLQDALRHMKADGYNDDKTGVIYVARALDDLKKSY